MGVMVVRKSLSPDKQVALAFRKWEKENPNANIKVRAAAFDRINDQVKNASS